MAIQRLVQIRVAPNHRTSALRTASTDHSWGPSCYIVALFFAWRSIYRPVQACQPDEVCAVPQTRRLYKFLFWASVALTLLALVYPYFAKYFY